MEQESSYINFLQTFINEEVYLFDSVNPSEKAQKVAEQSVEEQKINEEQNIVAEPAPAESYVSQLEWQGNQDAMIAFILDEKLPPETGQRFKKMLVNIGLKGNQVKSSYIKGKDLYFEKELDQMKAEKLIILSDLAFNQPMLENYKMTNHNNIFILKAPAFTEIVKEKNNVLIFWEALSKFLS